MDRRSGKNKRSGQDIRHHDDDIMAPDFRINRGRMSGKDRRGLSWSTVFYVLIFFILSNVCFNFSGKSQYRRNWQGVNTVCIPSTR